MYDSRDCTGETPKSTFKRQADPVQQPLMTVVLGSMTNLFIEIAQGGSITQTQHSINLRALYLVAIAIAVASATYISTYCFVSTGHKLANHIREEYLGAILRQDIAYVDQVGVSKFIDGLAFDVDLVQDGLSEKLAMTVTSATTFLTAMIVAFTRSPKLAAIMSTMLPFMFASTGLVGSIMAKHSRYASNALSSANDVAREATSSSRVVQGLGVEDRLCSLYTSKLWLCAKSGSQKYLWQGLMIGSINCILYLGYGLAFWEGSRLLGTQQLDTGTIVNVLFVIVIAAFSLGQVASNLQVFSKALEAGRRIFEIIDRLPKIDPYYRSCRKAIFPHASIAFENVEFSYPSRPNLKVLNDLTLDLPAQKMTGIVGCSGSGKSTIVALLERFYNVSAGLIKIAGQDIRNMDVHSLRSQIALVSQEPRLFSGSILENIKFGLRNYCPHCANDEDVEELVMEACRIANLTDWILTLPDGLNTMVGERGTLLSGGQKQRVAIARAVLSDAKIMIFDEVTAALDSQTEALVLDALYKAARGRTTIVITHRLSTIEAADKIVVLEKGVVAEEGSHNRLLSQGGIYASLVSEQGDDHPNTDTLDKKDNQFDHQLPCYSDVVSPLNERTLKAEEEAVELPPTLPSIILEIARFNRPEMAYMIVGSMATVLCGAAFPLQALVFAKLIVVFADPKEPNFRNNCDYYSAVFIAIGGTLLILHLLANFFLGLSCERMIARVRSITMRNILRQGVDWFDKEKNAPGSLVSSLSNECANMAGVHALTLGIFLSTLTNLLLGAIVSFILNWRLALASVSVIPLLLLSGYLRFALLDAFQRKLQTHHIRSNTYALEVVSSLQTVAALVQEKPVLKKYSSILKEATSTASKSVHKEASLFAISQALTYFANAFIIWYGAKLIGEHHADLYSFFVCFIAIVFGAQDAGESFSRSPALNKGLLSAQNVLNLYRRGPLPIDSDSKYGSKGVEGGSITFEKVSFSYPSRPGAPVLSNFNLDVPQGKHVALVGPSGSGKSTIVSLLEQFYRPTKGRILLNGFDIKFLNVRRYRDTIGLVSQDPKFFSGSIKENLLLAIPTSRNSKLPDTPNDATLEAVCREANILDFIQSLPQGFDTPCGGSGMDTNYMSGGQRQRLAIARALIRDPALLILDEATSALDPTSESAVLRALEQATRDRTTITIAHRLASVRKADSIGVLVEGRIVEWGSHDVLMAKRDGVYRKMWLTQERNHSSST